MIVIIFLAGEIIVNSKQQGRIIMNKDEEYLPGGRLYFDAKLIAKDGLLVRDGAHLKVKHSLPLDKYLIWYSTIDNVEIKGLKITPYNFAVLSDREFEKKFTVKLDK